MLRSLISRAGIIYVLLGKPKKDFFIVMKDKKLLIIGILFLGVISVGYVSIQNSLQSFLKSIHASTISVTSHSLKDYLSYQGENGKNALTLLKQYASVQVNNSGLITGVNGFTANPGKHEYWAFYVNKKLAQVGPASYITKNNDFIEWKIETY